MIHRLEPVWWFLFGAGGFVAAFTLPALIIGVFLLGPLGVFETGLAYERMVGLVSHPIGRVFMIVAVSLTLWHCAHHVRHFALDLGVTGLGPAYAAYGFALLGTLAAVVLTLGV